MSLVTRKPVFGVFDHVRLCSVIEASLRLEISDIETRGIILSRQRTAKALIRLRGCTDCFASLLFAYGKNRFSHDVAQSVCLILESTNHKNLLYKVITIITRNQVELESATVEELQIGKCTCK